MPSERYSFVCNSGCGVCSVKVRPFERERTETLEGEHVESKYEPQIVSSCCGSEVHVYDNDNEVWGEEVTIAATPAAPEPEPCPKCGGSGDTIVMSDGGPDAYEITVDCPHCNGQQTLGDAYEGVCKLLEREEKKYWEAAAIMFHASSGTAAGRLTDLAKYVSEPKPQLDWVRDRLLALADMARTATSSAAQPVAQTRSAS